MANVEINDLTPKTPVDSDEFEGQVTAGGASFKATRSGILGVGVDTQAHSTVLDATTASFLTADETKLDTIEANATADQTGSEIKTAYELEANTNAYTDAEKSKLVTIESGADANTVDSVNAKTGVVVIDPDDLVDTVTTNKFTTSAEITKLANIEALADVTATNETSHTDVLVDADAVTPVTGANKLITQADVTGGGDMAKSTYDTDNNGIVDNAEQVNSLTVETAVPAGAVFIDTVYDDTAIQAEVDLNTTHRQSTHAPSDADANQNAFGIVAVSGQSNVVSDVETDTLNLVAGANVTITTDDATDSVTINASSSGYTHPSHPGDDLDVDTTLLSGATVISDLDINVTTDTEGHVTDANGVYATRELTASDVSAEPELGNPSVDDYILSSTIAGVRSWINAGSGYAHPTHPGDDIDIDTTLLSGATVISDLNFNVETDLEGHVIDANGVFSTRDLTAGDIGAEVADSTIVKDADFTSNGILTRTAVGVYAVTSDNTTNWDTAYSHSQSAHAPTDADVTADNAPQAHTASHQSGGTDAIKLDDLAAPDDNTDLNVSITAHGLAPKSPNDAAQFLNGLGAYSTPSVGASDSIQKTVYNDTGSLIVKGAAVYITGWKLGNEVPTISLARADSVTTMPALGLVLSDISNSSEGMVSVVGSVTGVDTSGYNLDDALYVDASTAGAVTTTKPIGSNFIQSVARVTRVHGVLGTIFVAGALRSNDIPNFTAADKFWYGGTDGVSSEGDITAAGRAVIDDADAGAQRTTLGLVIGSDVQAYDADTAKLDVAQEYTATQNFNATTLTDGANISWDASANQVASVTLGGNRTLDNPTNMVDGATYILTVKQDATGTRTLAYGTAYKWAGGTAPTLTTDASAVDILTFICDGTSMYGVETLDFS